MTPVHAAALTRHGPCPEHRFSYVNVRRVGGRAVLVAPVREDDAEDAMRVLAEEGVSERGSRRGAGARRERGASRWGRRELSGPRHEVGSGEEREMSAEDLEKYETDMELQLYREYRDIVRQFAYVVETERRFYLANAVDLQVRNADGEVYFELRMSDAWVWDMYRPARFVKNVRVVTFKDVNVEELEKPDLEVPDA